VACVVSVVATIGLDLLLLDLRTTATA